MLKKSWLIRILVGCLATIAGLLPVGNGLGQEGYDQYGYNYVERRFNELYENADRNATNNTGDQIWLQMEWNDLYNVSQPDLSGPGAWVTNFQKGTYLGTDGNVYRWSYSVKLVYTGPGSPLWDYFSKEEELYQAAGDDQTPFHRPPVRPAPGP